MNRSFYYTAVVPDRDSLAERRYDIEAQWVINLICNYTCEYCFSSAPKTRPWLADSRRRLTPISSTQPEKPGFST